MSSVTYIPGKDSSPDKIANRLLSVLDGSIYERSKREIEVSYRNRLERVARLIDGGISLPLPEVEGVSPIIVRHALEAVRPGLVKEANDMFFLLAGELLALELEIWQLQNKTDN